MALGKLEYFGGGVKEQSLPQYHYAMGLEGFTGFFELTKHKSYNDALKTMEANLTNNNYDMSRVFRLDIPGKQQTLFGLSLQSDVEKMPYLNDKFVMDVIDYQDPRRSAHLPYEILVSGKHVIALHPHFRIAMNFPDIRMFGPHGFGRLLALPSA